MSKRSSLRLREDGEQRNQLGSSSQPDALFVSTKLSWKGKYERVFAITQSAVNTIDPKEWRVTNTWRFDAEGVSAAPVPDSPDTFQLLFKKGKKDKDMKFATAFRAQLVGEILRLRGAALGEPAPRVFPASGLTRQNKKRACTLRVEVDSVVELSTNGEVEWRRMLLPDISQVQPVHDVPGGVVLFHVSRPRLYALTDLAAFLAALSTAASNVGLGGQLAPMSDDTSLAKIRAKMDECDHDPTRVCAAFMVYKRSPRHEDMVQRNLMVTQRSIVERDTATYALKTVRSLGTLLGVVRKTGDENAQELALEFSDGAYYEYRCTARDQLLAVLIDMARSCGNSWVTLTVFPTPYTKRAGRLHPHIQEKDVLALESCYMSRFVAVAQRTASPTSINVEVIACAQDIVSQLPAQGISFEEKLKPMNIKTAVGATAQQLTALMQALRQKAVGSSERVQLMNETMIVLQAMRVLASTREGYRGYLRIPLVVDDLLSAMFDSDDGIGTAAMEVGASLVRAWRPGHTDEDTTENRRLLLTTKWCHKAVEAIREHSKRGTGQLTLPLLMYILESAICTPYASRTDTAQRTRIRETFADAATDMFGLFRYKTLSLTLKMALVMKTIMENCLSAVVRNIQEAALDEGVFLRHLNSAIFSDSFDQQQISRYLIELWADNFDSAEALMERVFPAGMVRRLQTPAKAAAPPPGPAHHDEYESDAHHNDQAQPPAPAPPGSNPPAPNRKSEEKKEGDEQGARVQGSRVQPDKAESVGSGLGGADGGADGGGGGGGRIGVLGVAKGESKWHRLWGMVSMDHSDIDLLWSQTTREELREAFEAEIRRFDSEIDLGLSQQQTVAWNHQEFTVRYASLNNELCVCGYYLSKLLAAVKDKKPLHVLNPHELHERLYTLFLQLPDSDSKKSIVLQCLTAVYRQDYRKMPPFADVQYVLGRLDQTRSSLMRDLLLLFVRALAADRRNAMALSSTAAVGLLVDLATEAHQTKNAMATPLAAGVLAIQDANGSTPKDESREWFIKNPEGVREGPFSIAQLAELMKEQDGKVARVREDTPFWADGVVDWAPLSSFRFLRWRLLMTDQPELTPRRVCLICCEVLYRLSVVAPTKNAKGNPIRPLPRAKAAMCEPRTLAKLTQLLLSSEPQVVDNACKLLEEVVTGDRVVLQKYYLTGVFFFALAYGGSNYVSIASLLKATHLDQAFRPDTATGQAHLTLGERSYLGVMLPESCITVLTAYPPTAFAETFTGNFDNPEVIWKFEMRKHLMCMLWQHIGDLPRRLKENPYLVYDFIPLPAVHYDVLADELWCHNFYLRTLCDPRYAEWPIKEPVQLLQAVLDAWRDELHREAPSQTEAQARTLLEVGADATPENIRQAYKRLARQFHPDKNPEGREKFEQVQAAYDLLSAARKPTGQPDIVNVLLIVQTHVIVYKRFSDTLAPFKFPGYPMLLDVIKETTPLLSRPDQAALFCASWHAVLLTAQASPGNSDELVGEGGVDVLARALHACLQRVTPETKLDDTSLQATTHMCSLLSVLGERATFRDQVVERGGLVFDAVRCLRLQQAVSAMVGVLEFVAKCAVSNALQDALVAGGALWQCTELLFGYDYTLEEQIARENVQKSTQAAKNVYAMLACAALGRMAGYLQVGTPAAPVNHDVCIAVSCMLTGVLALRLKHPKCADLLQILNTNVEIPTIIWNDAMRADLLAFVERELEKPWAGSGEATHLAKAAHAFSFAALEDELYVGQIYVRVYNEQPQTQLEHSPKVVQSMLKYLVVHRAKEVGEGPNAGANANAGASGERKDAFSKGYIDRTRAVLLALTHIAKAYPNTASEWAAGDWKALDVVMGFLQDEAVASADLCTRLLTLLSTIAELGDVASGVAQLRCVWRLLHCVRHDKTRAKPVLGILKALVGACSAIVPELVRFGAVLDVVLVVTQEELEVSLRALAFSVLAAMCQDATNGPVTRIHASKIVPPGLLAFAIADPQTGVAQFDGECESPELIWNTKCRKELASALVGLRDSVASLESEQASVNNVNWKLPDGYKVKFSDHEDEVVVGGVFLRLFLKDPQFDLRDPKAFLEAMLEAFFKQWQAQSQQTVERYMELVSGIVSICKTRPSLTDHVATLGYLPKLVQLLLEAQGDVRIIKETAIVRLWHEFASSEKCVERLASVPNTFEALMKVMRPIPRPLAFTLDTTKLLLERNLRVQPSLVPQAIEAKVIPFLLSLLEEVPLDHVDDPGAAKVHAIGCLQMMSRSPTHGEQVTLILDQNPVWERYKNQKHDLFISRQQKKDYFLTDGAASTTKLLTSGQE